jgi:predicted RNA-binding protein YlqC (UPF0109 family)
MSAAKEQILVATNTQAETAKTITDLKQALADKEQFILKQGQEAQALKDEMNAAKEQILVATNTQAETEKRSPISKRPWPTKSSSSKNRARRLRHSRTR